MHQSLLMKRRIDFMCRKRSSRSCLNSSFTQRRKGKTKGAKRHSEFLRLPFLLCAFARNQSDHQEKTPMTDTTDVGNQLRLDLLREALPYIRRFKGKTFVVKLSGKVTEDHTGLISLAEELALMHQVGIRLCVVHGGGKQLSDLAALMGVQQTIIEGRRVTDDATLEMAKMIFAGKINTDILAALRHRGVEAVGLSGVDGNIIHAERRPPSEVVNRETGASKQVDFGHVGDIIQIDSRLLTVLLDQGYLPVISSLGADAEGKVFNINADTIAAEIAIQLQAEK